MTGCKCKNDLELKVKYHYRDEEDVVELVKFAYGDWIDLRSAFDVTMQAGEFKYISLGVTIEVPPGWEIWIAPRSSTFKTFGIIQTNSIGVIDQTYCGDEDILHLPSLAMRDTEIKADDRICQFRLIENQPNLKLETVDSMENESRGGLGHSGTR